MSIPDPASLPRPESKGGLLLLLRGGFIVAYPLLVLTAVRFESGWIRAGILPLAVALIVAPALARGSKSAWLAVSAAAGLGAAMLAWPALGMWPPVIVTTVAAAIFCWSLMPGKEPLLLRFAQAIHHALGTPLPDGAREWLTAWTLAWAAFLVVIAATLGILAGFRQPEAWALVALATPLICAALLVLEWVFRRRAFPAETRMGLLAFFRAVARVDWTRSNR